MLTLLLDDNLMTQTRVQAQLKAAGGEVTTRRALPATGEFELIVVNLGSRSMPGLDLLQAAKMQYPGVKIWAFCGHLEIEIRRSALKIGLDKLLTNEVAMSELAPQVQAAFAGATQKK
jgi:DNA-binding NarL/FixJ family response regulator